jgi:hypothetical protein
MPLSFGVDQEWGGNIFNEFKVLYPSSINFPPTRSVPYCAEKIDRHILMAPNVVGLIADILEKVLQRLSSLI